MHTFDNGSWKVLETLRSMVGNTGPESRQPECQCVWSLRCIDAAVARDENSDGGSTCDDGRPYYLAAENVNVTVFVDTTDDALDRYLYNPYGVLTVYDAAWSNIRSASSCDIEFTYAGRTYDKKTSLYYYRHRCLNAELGRFLSRDPLGYRGGSWGVYSYVDSQPLVNADPTGMIPPGFDPWNAPGGSALHPTPGPFSRPPVRPVSSLPPNRINGCGTGVPGFPLDQLFYRPQRLTSNLGAWMQVEVNAKDLCVTGKLGEITIDLTLRWVNYARHQHRNRNYQVTIDGEEVVISESNETGEMTPVNPPEAWPWPPPLGKITVRRWYAWTGSYTKQLANCPAKGDGSVDIKVEVFYEAPDGHNMVETATVEWSYSCAGNCNDCRIKNPFKCKIE